MVVSLYTSRIVLQVLGIDDFGTYNIVGGVVVMFTFISSAMATGTQRHMSYELGKDSKNLAVIFSACFRIHLVLALIVFILAETIGLWFLNSKMNFPPENMSSVNWIYQFSIITCMIGIIQVPYIASIIAHEKMSFYACISIVDALMKLGLVFLLKIIPCNKLILYSILVASVQSIIFLTYACFCHSKFADIRFVKIEDKRIYRKLLSFSGWLLFGAASNVGYQQGINIIINIFYGVTLNAAVGIANQVNSAVQNFVTNFQQALNPQLTKAEASKDRERQKDLIYKSSKFSFFIMFLISYPLAINLPYILYLWLGEYPPHTVGICIWVLTGVLITSLSGPLWVTIYAVGVVKAYQIIVSIVALGVLPIIYVGGIYGMTPEQMFIVRAFDYILVLLIQLWFLNKYINFKCLQYFRTVILPVVMTIALTLGFYMVMNNIYEPATNFKSLLIQSLMYLSFCCIVIIFIGLKRSERKSIISLLCSKLK